jgi:hypothetical protein
MLPVHTAQHSMLLLSPALQRCQRSTSQTEQTGLLSQTQQQQRPRMVAKQE